MGNDIVSWKVTWNPIKKCKNSPAVCGSSGDANERDWREIQTAARCPIRSRGLSISPIFISFRHLTSLNHFFKKNFKRLEHLKIFF